MKSAVCLGLPLVGIALLVASSPSVARAEKDTRPVVIHVGDSFVASGFAQALKPKFAAIGVKYLSTSQTSAYSTTLIRQVKLDSLITVNKPALVIITIGANEMRMPVPEQHAHAVKNISKLASQTSCVWAIPPRWDDKETGFLAVMKREAGPCKVHDPSAIEKDLPRGPDKVHPSAKGGAMWADHFWAWMMAGKTEGQMPWDAPAEGAKEASK